MTKYKAKYQHMYSVYCILCLFLLCSEECVLLDYDCDFDVFYVNMYFSISVYINKQQH